MHNFQLFKEKYEYIKKFIYFSHCMSIHIFNISVYEQQTKGKIFNSFLTCKIYFLEKIYLYAQKITIRQV